MVSLRDLSVLAYANGFTLWHLKASALERASAPGFLAPAADLLAAGDMVMVSAPDGGRVLCIGRDADGPVARPLA